MLFLKHVFTKNDKCFIEDSQKYGEGLIGLSRQAGEVTEQMTNVYHVICECSLAVTKYPLRLI